MAFQRNHKGYWLGKPLTAEHKKKISLSNKGKKLSEEHKKKLSIIKLGKKQSEKHIKKRLESRKGYRHSKATRRKMSDAHKGKKCFLWKGGITSLILQVRMCFEYRQWRSDIFTRDNFTCQNCFKRGGKLNAHHLKSFAQIFYENNIKTMKNALGCQELWNINNGITFCKNCHCKTKNYGKVNK